VIRSEPGLSIPLTFLLFSFSQARLVETGAKKLAQLFTKVVASGSSGNPPAGSEFQFSLFPREELTTLQPLVKFLRGLPLPATHPSHPAAAAILSALKDAQRGYAEMRGNWARKCLEVYGRRVVDRAETTDGISAGGELGKWTRNLLDVIEVSFSGLNSVPPDLASGRVQPPHPARPTSRPIASLLHLHRACHTSNYSLQFHAVFTFNPNQAFITQVHLSRTGFLLGTVNVPGQMGRTHHPTCRTEGKRTQGRLACSAWGMPAQLPGVPSRPQASRNGEGWRDWDGVRRVYDHGAFSSLLHVNARFIHSQADPSLPRGVVRSS